MVIFNAWGAGIALLAVFVLTIVDRLAPRPGLQNWQSLVLFGLLLLGPDLVLRLRHRGVDGWKALGLPTSGGHIFFFPMWAWGLVAVVAAIFNL